MLVTITVLFSVPFLVSVIRDSSTRVLCQYPAEASGCEAGEIWQGMAVNFAYEVSLSYTAGFF
jgi:hypothetical protein